MLSIRYVAGSMLGIRFPWTIFHFVFCRTVSE
jgi:hypothetical protein